MVLVYYWEQCTSLSPCLSLVNDNSRPFMYKVTSNVYDTPATPLYTTRAYLEPTSPNQHPSTNTLTTLPPTSMCRLYVTYVSPR